MKNWDNYNYVYQMVKSSGISIMFASKNLRADKSIILEASKSFDFALEYASPALKQDYNFTLSVIKESALSVLCVDIGLSKNIKWQTDAITINPNVFFYLAKIDPNVKSNADLCLLASAEAKCVTEFDDSIFSSTDLVIKMVSKNPQVLKYISCKHNGDGLSFCADPAVIIAATHKSAYAITYASTALLNNEQILSYIIELNPKVYAFLPQNIKTNANLAICAIKGDASVLNDVPKLVCSFSFLADAIAANPDCINYLSSADFSPKLLEKLIYKNIDKKVIKTVLSKINQKNNSAQINDII